MQKHPAETSFSTEYSLLTLYSPIRQNAIIKIKKFQFTDESCQAGVETVCASGIFRLCPPYR